MMNSLPAWRRRELRHWDLWDDTGGLREHLTMYGHMCQWWDCPHGCTTRLWLRHQHDSCTASIVWVMHSLYCMTHALPLLSAHMYDSTVCLYLDHCSKVYIRRASWRESPQLWSLRIPTFTGTWLRSIPPTYPHYSIRVYYYLWPCQCVALTEPPKKAFKHLLVQAFHSHLIWSGALS